VRLREHQELRAVLKLQAVPDYTTLYRFLRRLEDDTIDRGLQETVRRLRRRRRRPISAAIDGTGLSDTSVSTFFHRRLEQHAHGTRPRRPWLKWLIVVDVQQQILLAQRARPGCDARSLPGLLDVAARGAPLGVVLADAEFDSEANHQHISATPGSEEHYPRKTPGCPQRRYSESDVPRLSEKTVPPTRQDRKHFLGGQTQALLARTRTQPPGHADPPSPAARPCLQPLPPEASVRSERMSTEPNSCGRLCKY